MKTYKLPIVIEEDDKSYINDLCRQQSIIVRSSYNDLLKGNLVKDLEQKYKSLNNIEDMDSWFIRCGILRGKSLTKHKHIIFGGKHTLSKLNKKKITKEEWKNRRLYSLDIQGEKHQGGNRKFELKLEENQILFKPNRNKKILIQLPKIRRKWKNELQYIQETESCFSIKLTNNTIEIVVDELLFKHDNYSSIKGRILGIDLNPDYIGYNITDFPKKKVVIKECYNTEELNTKSGLSSDHPKSKYLKNKRKYEYLQICHEIIQKCIHYKVEKLCIEDLNIKSQDFGNKHTNRKNNLWMKTLINNKLKMLCNIVGIEYVEINPAYTSIIGNLVYNDFDPISASREISRRGYYKYQKGKFYPGLESVKHQWKEMVTEDINSWKEFATKLKTLDIRYRVPLNENHVVSRLKYIKKKITLYSFI